MTQYPVEVLGPDDDDGTMIDSKAALERAVVGHKIVKVEKAKSDGWYEGAKTIITLDNNTQVRWWK